MNNDQVNNGNIQNVENEHNPLINNNQDNPVLVNNQNNSQLENNQNNSQLENQINSDTKIIEWQDYSMARNEQSLFRFFCRSWFKFRNTLLYPFWVKVPKLQKSIGNVILILIFFCITVALIIIPFALGNTIPTALPDIMLGLTFMLSSRNSILTFLTGISFESQIILHKYAAYFAYMSSAAHGLDYYLSEGWGNRHTTGAVLLGAMFILTFTGVFFKFFDTFYQLFYYIHVVFLITCIIFSFIHGAKISGIFGVIFYCVDILIRLIFIKIYQRSTVESKIELLTEDVIKLSFNKKKARFHYKVAQFCQIIIPKLTIFESHPFSMNSAPQEDEVVFLIKVCGDWTKRLQHFVKNLKPDERKISIMLNGPYGHNMLDLDGTDYEVLLLVSGGIGITPMQSTVKSYLIEASKGRPLKKIFFIWTCRNPEKINNNFCDIDEIYAKYFPDQIEGNQEKVLEQFLHVTGKIDLAELQNNIRNSDQNIDADSIYSGRPNLEKYFEKAHSFCQKNNVKKIGILTCGPKKMMDKVISLSQSYNGKDSIVYHYHFETFGFLDHIF